MMLYIKAEPASVRFDIVFVTNLGVKYIDSKLFKYVLITDISRLYSNFLSTDARCLVNILGGQCDVVDFE